MLGYGWVALGSADTISDPTCGPSKAAITTAARCAASTNWKYETSLCMSGSIPALGTPPDYTANWGVQVGVNAMDPQTAGGLGQTFSSVTITVTGSPTTGLRAIVHRKGDPEATTYCAAFAGAAIPFTTFNTECWPNGKGVAITAADVPNIDQVGIQVPSSTTAITVTDLCITGITFAQ